MVKVNLLTILFIFISCSSSDDLAKRTSPEQDLKEALLQYHEGDYDIAKQNLYAITIKYSGTKVAEDAQFYLAETNFKIERFLVAAHSYNQIMERYTSSEYAERAQYKEAYSYERMSPSYNLDQKYTLLALKKYDEFLTDWPKTEFRDTAEKNMVSLRNKLAEKKYNTALIYFKMEKWQASTKYADFVLKDFDDTEFIDDAHLLKTKVYVQKKQWIQAEQELELLLSKFPELEDSDRVKEAHSLILLGKQEKING
jgi:outer membrane protein assembly factor BamD